jgi:integrase
MKRIGGAAQTFWTPEQVSALLTAARDHSERDYLAILVLLNHALRASELISLTPSDIRDGQLYVTRLKKSARTVQPLTDAEREPLLFLCRDVQPDGRLFPITRQHLWRIVQKHCKTAGIPLVSAHPHSAKHTTCRAILGSTGNLRTVQQYAGHSSITSTVVYTKQNDAEASAAAAQALVWGERAMGAAE